MTLWANNGEWVKVSKAWYKDTDNVWKTWIGGFSEDDFGTPFATYNQQDDMDSIGGYGGFALFAIDVGPFDEKTEGVLFEMGADAYGAGLYLHTNGNLRAAACIGSPWKSSQSTWIEVDVSEYFYQSGTFYWWAGPNAGLKVWWKPENSEPILLGTGNPINDDLWGSSQGACGHTRNNVRDFGITPVDYTGVINELRWWKTANTQQLP